MKRLALVLCGHLSEMTGGFVYDRRLTEELQRAGVSLEVVALPWRRYGLQLAQNLSPRWLSRLRRLEADVVLQDELCHPALVGLNRWTRRPGSPPRVGIVHHLRSREAHPAGLAAIYRWIEAAYLRTLDGFIFNSHHTQDSVQALIGARAPSLVAHPGRESADAGMQPRATPGAGEPLQILFVGALTPRKGLHTLFQALQALEREDWRLDVVGRADLDANYAREMTRVARRAGLRARVQFHGHLARAELVERYRRAHLLVVPSQLEGFGMAYLEAMGFGVPVVASAVGGAGELVEEGRNGYLVPPESPESLARILRALLEDPARLEPLRRAARARFEAHPTWRESARRVMAFLDGLAEGSSRRPLQRGKTVPALEPTEDRRSV